MSKHARVSVNGPGIGVDRILVATGKMPEAYADQHKTQREINAAIDRLNAMKNRWDDEDSIQDADINGYPEHQPSIQEMANADFDKTFNECLAAGFSEQDAEEEARCSYAGWFVDEPTYEGIYWL